MNEYEQHYKMNSALQQEEQGNRLSLSAPQIQEYLQQAQAILVSQTNPQKVIKQIELQLCGQEEREDGSIWEVSEPMMNEYGVSRIKFLLRSVVNQNTILSHLKENEINKLMRGLGDDLAMNLALNWRKYGVKSRGDLDDITISVLIPVYASLKRALGQNEKNWLGKITVESLGGNQKPQFREKGFFSKFRL